MSKRQTVLYFEDDPLLAEVLKIKLGWAGFRVVHHTSPAPDPVALALKTKPDVVLMDIIMPQMDGFRATQLLKADERTRAIPVFGLSNLGQPEDFQNAHRVGMSMYWVTAQHMPDEVVAKVRELISESPSSTRSASN